MILCSQFLSGHEFNQEPKNLLMKKKHNINVSIFALCLQY